MTQAAFLGVLVGVPAVVTVLDLADRHARRKHQGTDPIGWETAGFLSVVLAVYVALQAGGMRLVPAPFVLADGVRGWFAARLGLPLGTDPLRGPALLLVAAFAFYTAALWDYLAHRFLLHHRRLFFLHENHHLPNQVTVTLPGLAVRPFAVFAVVPTILGTIVTVYGALAACGLPLWDLRPLQLVVLAQGTVLVTSHSSFLRRFRWLHRGLRLLAITSPQDHVLHHAAELRGNYGNSSTLWDRVFGTYLDPERDEHRDPRLGLSYDQDFLGTLTLGRIKLSP
ncbi:MAG TPA: sterol desaturase family protein, partial [Candidatus Polarisedimenticolia bacterium]|nr:sterol desaturase family protein [Candidatus Polarisedimenticolia bacterium]